MGNVVVVGSVNVDFVVTVERLPQAGQTVSGGSFERFGGGKGANQAVAAARAGAQVQMVGCVGADADGATALAELASELIDTTHVRQSSTAATGVALITVAADGGNQIAVAPGANRLVEDFPETTLTGDRGTLLLSFEAPDAVLCQAAEAAMAAGWSIVVNPAPWRPLPPRLLACHPLLVPNEHEATDLTGESDHERAAVMLHELTGAAVIVTLGKDGALLCSVDGVQRIAAPIVEAVDTTGAGDCLCGTLAAGIAEGLPLAEALAGAVAAASQSTLTPGAR
jgi:ribokinase